MTVTNRTTFQLEVEHKVKQALTTKPLTIKELEKATGNSYHTTRRAVRSLQEAGIVFTSSANARNQKYRIDPDARKIAFMPLLATGDKRVPIINMLSWVGNEVNMAAVGASKAIPNIITRLLFYGVRATKGDEVAGDLIRLRTELLNNRRILQNLLSIYDQIIEQQELWSPAALAKITDDSRFDTELVLRSYEHYYPVKGTEELVTELVT